MENGRSPFFPRPSKTEVLRVSPNPPAVPDYHEFWECRKGIAGSSKKLSIRSSATPFLIAGAEAGEVELSCIVLA